MPFLVVVAGIGLACNQSSSPAGVGSDPDINDDGRVDILDISLVHGCRADPNGDPECAHADVTGDGVVDDVDVALVTASFGDVDFPVSPVVEATRLLCEEHDLVAADDELIAFLSDPASATNPRLDTALFLRAMTRVARPLVEQAPGPDPNAIDSLSELADALGIGAAGRDPLAFTATLPVNLDGTCILPTSGVRGGDVQRVFDTELLPRISASIDDLARTDPEGDPIIDADWGVSCNFENELGIAERVEADVADALMLRALLFGARGGIQFLRAQDTDVDLAGACTLFNELRNQLTTAEQAFMDPDFTNFLHPADDTSSAPLAAADFQQGISLFGDAFDAVLAETDDQIDDLLSIDRTQLTPEKEQLFRDRVAATLASFQMPTAAPGAPGFTRCGGPEFEIGQLFTPADLRALAPPFVGNLASVDAFPDFSFGGILPTGDQAQVRCLLDHRGPDVVEQVPEREGLSPLSFSLRFADPQLGGSPGHGVDPASLTAFVFTFPFGECPLTVNGTLVEPGLDFVDITTLVDVTENADGSVTMSALIEGDPDSQRCFVDLFGEVADGIGNQDEYSAFFDLVSSGPVVSFDPPSESTVSSPFAVSIDVTAPFADVDPASQLIELFSGDCGEVSVNGASVPPFASIKELLDETVVPGVSAHYSGTIAVTTTPCGLQISVRDPVVGGFIPGTFYFVQ